MDYGRYKKKDGQKGAIFLGTNLCINEEDWYINISITHRK